MLQPPDLLPKFLASGSYKLCPAECFGGMKLHQGRISHHSPSCGRNKGGTALLLPHRSPSRLCVCLPSSAGFQSHWKQSCVFIQELFSGTNPAMGALQSHFRSFMDNKDSLFDIPRGKVQVSQRGSCCWMFIFMIPVDNLKGHPGTTQVLLFLPNWWNFFHKTNILGTR